MKEDFTDGVMDAAIIGAAQRVEHYEIAAYGTARAFAEILGENEHVSLLQQTLDEEKQTDQKLMELAQEVNPRAAQPSKSEEEEESTTTGSHSRTSTKSKRAA